jgi:Rrf2 family protein
MTKLVRISEAASLALHAMAMLYQCDRQRFTNQEISERLGASEHHLAKVMQRLAKAGLVESLRGPQGGFCLGPAATDARLLAIYEAIEGPLSDEGCLLSSAVCERQQCVLGDLAARVHNQVREYLMENTLAQFAPRLAILSDPLAKRPAAGHAASCFRTADRLSDPIAVSDNGTGTPRPAALDRTAE